MLVKKERIMGQYKKVSWNLILLVLVCQGFYGRLAVEASSGRTSLDVGSNGVDEQHQLNSAEETTRVGLTTGGGCYEGWNSCGNTGYGSSPADGSGYSSGRNGGGYGVGIGGGYGNGGGVGPVGGGRGMDQGGSGSWNGGIGRGWGGGNKPGYGSKPGYGGVGSGDIGGNGQYGGNGLHLR